MVTQFANRSTPGRTGHCKTGSKFRKASSLFRITISEALANRMAGTRERENYLRGTLAPDCSSFLFYLINPQIPIPLPSIEALQSNMGLSKLAAVYAEKEGWKLNKGGGGYSKKLAGGHWDYANEKDLEAWSRGITDYTGGIYDSKPATANSGRRGPSPGPSGDRSHSKSRKV